LNLAEFASHAVDYPKTGTPVDFTSLPPPPQSERPDFLSGEGSIRRLNECFYRSQKVLGTMFRRVLIDDETPAHQNGDSAPSDGDKIWSCLQEIIEMPDLGLPPLEDPLDDLMDEMEHLLEAYSDRLLAIAQAYTLSKHLDSKLSEEELVSGTIMASWADHNKCREAVISMNLQVSIQRHSYSNVQQFSLQTQQLTKAIRSEFVRGTDTESADDAGWDSDDSDDEESDRQAKIATLGRAWAAWNVAEDAINEDPESFGPLSFGIIALGTILKLIKKLRTQQ
jgi:hypothetical protein